MFIKFLYSHSNIIKYQLSLALQNINKVKSLGNFSTSKSHYKFKNTDHRQSSESLLKQYFSSRLSLSPSQIERYLISLSQNGDVKIRDHRWESLYMTVQKYHKDFTIDSKIQIIHALGRMKQNNSLYTTLYKSLVSDLHKLTLQQESILLWSMIKVKQVEKPTVMAIYKKLYKILQNDQKIQLYSQNQQIPSLTSLNPLLRQDEGEVIHRVYESSFVHLIWAFQSSNIIDDKLILDLMKHTFQETKNLNKIRIENLCLLAYCIDELEFQKYRVSQSVINQIMSKWEELEHVSVLSLVLLAESFAKFITYQRDYLQRYEKKLKPQEITAKTQVLQKEQNFFLLIIQTIFLKQEQEAVKRNIKRKPKKSIQVQQEEDSNQLKPLKNPLSSKFASRLIFALGKINVYEKGVWFKLLQSITQDVDQAGAQDVSMSLTGICNLSLKDVPPEDVKPIIYSHKKMICKRAFQIYNSLSGKSLHKIKELVYNKQIENELVPPPIRKEIEKQFMSQRMKQNKKKPDRASSFQDNQQQQNRFTFK